MCCHAIRLGWLPGVVVVAVGWVAFVASFFLPATNVLERGGTPPGTPLVGWDAAVSSLAVLTTKPLVLIAEPRAFLFLLFPLVNLIALLSPVLALRSPDSVAWLAPVLLPAAVLPLLLPKTLTGDLFIGFYTWAASFAVLAAGYIMVSLSAHRRRPLAPPFAARAPTT